MNNYTAIEMYLLNIEGKTVVARSPPWETFVGPSYYRNNGTKSSIACVDHSKNQQEYKEDRVTRYIPHNVMKG